MIIFFHVQTGKGMMPSKYDLSFVKQLTSLLSLYQRDNVCGIKPHFEWTSDYCSMSTTGYHFCWKAIAKDHHLVRVRLFEAKELPSHSWLKTVHTLCCSCAVVNQVPAESLFSYAH